MNELPVNDDVMNYKQLSAYLKMGETTLRQKVMKGTIPSFKIDGAVQIFYLFLITQLNFIKVILIGKLEGIRIMTFFAEDLKMRLFRGFFLR